MPIALIDLPASGLVAERQSAPIACTYPQRQGPYTVADWAIPIVEETLTKTLLSGMMVRLYHLRDVYACGEGFIFNDQGQLYAVTGHQFPPERITQAHREVQEGLFVGTVPTYDVPLVQCKRASPFVFGHWMVDMLPMAYLAQTLLPAERAASAHFMVHRTHGPMDAVFEATLGRLSIPPEQLAWTSNDPIFCRELYLVTGVSDHGKFVTSFVSDCHDRISRTVSGSGASRLFVLRGGHVRALREETMLAEIARSKGYAVLDATTASIEAQIAAFKDARLVVGTMGSALANLVYCQPGAQVMILTPEAMPETFFWLICQLRRLRYREIRCQQVGEALPPPYPPWARDMVIDPTAFSLILDGLDTADSGVDHGVTWSVS